MTDQPKLKGTPEPWHHVAREFGDCEPDLGLGNEFMGMEPCGDPHVVGDYVPAEPVCREVARLREIGVRLANLVRRTMIESTVTHSDDPGCWHCDDGLTVDQKRDEWGHAEDCEAVAVLRAWREATKHLEATER